MKPQQTLVNGQKQDKISVRDRALQFGDGVFETFAINNGEALAWDRHISRLLAACLRLGIVCPDSHLLQGEAMSLCKNSQRAVLKLIISRGEGGRGYQLPQHAQTTRIFSLHDWPEYPPEYEREGIVAGIFGMRLGRNPALAGMKHLNRLEQVLLKKELSETNFAEAIAMDINDEIIEGSMSNIFLVKNDQLFTPDLSYAGVEGIVRASILELSNDIKLKSEIKRLKLEDVHDADEIFFCNSLAGIWPVKQIGETRFGIGPVTRKIQSLLRDKNLIVML